MLTLEEQNELLIECQTLSSQRPFTITEYDVTNNRFITHKFTLRADGTRDYVRTITENTPKSVK